MKKSEVKENLVYLLIWVLLLLSPVISMWLRMNGDSSMVFSWDEVLRSWRIIAPFLIVFIVHNYLVAPLLIYRKKPVLYWTLALCVVFIFQLYQCNDRPDRHRPDRFALHRHDHPRPFDDMPPPEPGDSAGWAEAHDSARWAEAHDSTAVKAHHRPHGRPHFRHGHREGMQPDEGMRPRHHLGRRHRDGFRRDYMEPPIFIGQRDLIALIILVLMLGMNLGIKLYFKSSKDSKRMQELEKKSLEQQLEYLKYQINPHFFMNTLNNIHALIDIEPEEAKGSIVELSKMMRYVLYEGTKSQVLLSKDLEFIKHYIQLMRLRYTDKVRIDIQIADSLTDKMVPPMLFITFVENAFKHGVTYKQPSFIEVSLKTTEERVCFCCRNSKASNEHHQGGVGLTNTRQRLDIIYGDDYSLLIDDNDITYEVTLDIPFLTTQDVSDK